jgi:two-component system, cell cycle response regulator DivK
MNELKKKVLVVEDDEASFQLIDASLKSFELQMLRAKNGKQALQICDQNRDIRLVLLDIQLPGMNGYEVLAEIKKTNPEIPIVAQTAYSMIDDREKCLEAGCDEYLSKPLNLKKLRELVKKILQ